MPRLGAEPVTVSGEQREALERLVRNPAVGLACPDDPAGSGQCGSTRQRAGAGCIAEDRPVLAETMAAGCGRRIECPAACRCVTLGSSGRFHAGGICAVVSMTCEKPSDSERPISQWSQREIADEAMRRGIVKKISQRSVGRFLKKAADLKPHRVCYWLTPKPDPAFDAKCADICEVYKAAAGADDSHRSILVDEMTGIQALERIAPGLPMLPGKIERRSNIVGTALRP